MTVLDVTPASAPPIPATAASPASRFTAGWRLVLICVGLAVITHLPSLLKTEVLNPDEGFLGTQAQVLNEGGQLYRDVVDRKPPIMPLLYAGAFRLTGTESLIPLRLLAIAAHVATALLLAAIARRRWGDTAALTAAALYLVASGGLVVEDSQAATFEVFMLPTMVLAMYLGSKGRDLGAGVALSFSTLTKQVAATTLLPLGVYAWRRDRWRGLALLTVGFAVPIMVSAALFRWNDFWFWVFAGNGGYLDASGSWGKAVIRGLGTTGIFVAANLGAFLMVRAAKQRWRDDLDLWLWLAAAVVGVAAGFRFFGHYYFQLMPPVALLAAGALAKAKPVEWARTLMLATASVVAFAVLGFTVQPPVLRDYGRIAASIDALSRPGDRILVWGQFPQAYWASDRLPASRYLTAGFLTGFSGGRAEEQIGEQFAVDGAWDEFVADLLENPPKLIVDTSPIIDKEQRELLEMDRYPKLAEFVRDKFLAVITVDGAVIYVRRPGAW